MDVMQTACVVAIVLGPAAASSVLGAQYADLLGPDLLGNDPWNVPLGKRPQVSPSEVFFKFKLMFFLYTLIL